jgi:hypothetical protein
MNYENYKSGFNKPTIITAQQYGTKISVELDHSDTDLDELMNAFETLVVGLGYSKDAWKNWITERAEEYHETDTDDLKEKLKAWKFDNDNDIELRHSNDDWNEELPEFDWEGDYFGASDELFNKRPTNSHHVTNDEADEDASHMKTSFPIVDPFTSETKSNFNGATQSILDFVEMQGDATYTEMNNYYRKAFGSNSFSHILKSLRIPYKNRPTRRYLVKQYGSGVYEVRIADESNWVDLNS